MGERGSGGGGGGDGGIAPGGFASRAFARFSELRFLNLEFSQLRGELRSVYETPLFTPHVFGTIAHHSSELNASAWRDDMWRDDATFRRFAIQVRGDVELPQPELNSAASHDSEAAAKGSAAGSMAAMDAIAREAAKGAKKAEVKRGASVGKVDDAPLR